MRVSRLFVDKNLNSGHSIELDAETGHYVRSVLRLKQGQSIILFNGQGGEYVCKLGEVSKKSVRVDIEEHIDRDVESPLLVRLGIGISRGDRMDWAIQKAVELGVNHLTPLVTERCVIKFSPEKSQQRLQHWQNIILHAAEQSGRNRLPELGKISNLPDWTNLQQDLKVFLDPHAGQVLTDFQAETKVVTLLSGPEGGFSEQERRIAISSGFIPVRMGARILRTETAVLAALAAVQTLWGDFR